MVLVREEEWGQIVYVPEADRFLARVCRDAPKLSIDRPLSVSCHFQSGTLLLGSSGVEVPETLARQGWNEVFHKLLSWGVHRILVPQGEQLP